jgi:hypothetical protein
MGRRGVGLAMVVQGGNMQHRVSVCMWMSG